MSKQKKEIIKVRIKINEIKKKQKRKSAKQKSGPLKKINKINI